MGRDSKNKSEIVQFRNMLRGTKKPLTALAMTRRTLPSEYFGEAIGWIHSTPVIARKLFPSDRGYPRTLAQLNEQRKTVRLFEPMSSEREFRWAAAYLIPHAARIRDFIIRASAFQRAFLADDFTKCTTILEDVEHRFGQSFWLIKNRLPLLQAMSGLEAQKNYAESIRHIDNSSSSAVVAFYTSMRNEPSVTPMRFKLNFEAWLQKSKVNAELAVYLRYHITPSIIREPMVFAEVLRREQVGSILDYYEALVCLSQIAAATGQIDLDSNLRPVIASLYSRTNDPRLGAILAGLGAPSPDLPASHSATLMAGNALLRGDYARAAVDAATTLAEDPSDPDALMIAATAAAMLPIRPESVERPLNLRLVSRLAGVIAKDTSASKDSVEIIKMALNFFGAPWANMLLGVVQQETSPTSIVGPFAHLAALSIPAVHPFRTLWLPRGDARTKYAHLADRMLGSSPATAYALAASEAQSTAQLPEDISWDERTLLEATQSFAREDFAATLNAASHLEQSSHPYYRRRAIRVACNALLRLRRTEECIDQLTTAYVLDRTAHDLLPISDAAESIAADESRALAGNLSVPILFELYTRHISNKYDSECMFACVEFLEKHGLQRPSELRGLRDRFEHKKLVYFLRYVCVEPIMDRSSMFGSSRALLEERLDICRLLVELDADGVDAYHTEIKALLRRLMLQKRMKEVEQSKIFVDTDSIKRTVAEDLREAFNRYVALRNERIEFVESPEFESAFKKATNGDLTELHELVSQSLPKNETGELFRSIIRRLRDEYFLSPEHGLDKYLSVRIRHGTLAAHLRKPVELAKLVTLREIGSKDYKKNEHWPKRIKGTTSDIRDWIADRLATFSRDFDQLVEDVKARIQIRKTPEGSGLFELTLPERQFRIFSENVTPETTFEQLVDSILEWFGGLLDTRLTHVRAHITHTAKTRASDLLESLAADIEHFSDRADTGELTNAIRIAKTDLQVAFDRVSAWFRRARVVANEPFPLEDAIDIGAETVRTVAQDFHTEVQVASDEPLLLPGIFLATFVDIFFIIFENIVRHAGMDSAPIARVSVGVGERRIQILVENDLGHGVTSEDARSKVSKIKSDMRAGLHVASVNREGGTGLHKLGKLLAHDLGSELDLDFGFSDDTHFFVRFSAPETIRTPFKIP